MSFITGVNDTGGKFMTGVNDTRDKFMTSVKATGDKFMTGVIDTGDESLDTNISANAMLRIRDVHPGSRISDPGSNLKRGGKIFFNLFNFLPTRYELGAHDLRVCGLREDDLMSTTYPHVKRKIFEEIGTELKYFNPPKNCS